MLTKKELMEILESVPDDVEVKLSTANNGYHHLEIDNVVVSINRNHPEDSKVVLEDKRYQ